MPTPHNEAKFGEIAPLVLLPGDPKRSELIATDFLTDAVLVNTVRLVNGYTGKWKGVPVSVMATGMGVPAMGIYSWELYNEYKVDSIIRIGTCGSIHPKLSLGNIVAAQGISTDSNYAEQFDFPGIFAPLADYSLLQEAVKKAEERNIPLTVGNVFCSDHFYYPSNAGDTNRKLADMGVLALEMESVSLYTNAAYLRKKALTLCTVSDDLVREQRLSPEERVRSLSSMIELALDTLISVGRL